jgi:predicted deacylase
VSAPLIGGATVARGERRNVELHAGRLPSGAPVAMPVTVVHGAEPGPGLWLTAATHGDEIVGTEAIRRILARLDPAALAGLVIAAPIVNVHGFAESGRYLPDRRDLNRSFPGSARGSLASRLAHLLMTEVVAHGQYGIDLHTGSDHRSNLPQVRADLDDPETRRLASAFGAPVMLHSRSRDGSLREAACRTGSRVLLYEGGEALRYDDWAIDAAVDGIWRVLAHLGMIEGEARVDAETPLESRRTSWVRAPGSGMLRARRTLGERVVKGEVVGTLGDAFGEQERPVKARATGLVIGRTERPVVYRGDAIFHIAEVSPSADGG